MVILPNSSLNELNTTIEQEISGIVLFDIIFEHFFIGNFVLLYFSSYALEKFPVAAVETELVFYKSKFALFRCIPSRFVWPIKMPLSKISCERVFGQISISIVNLSYQW